MGAAFLITLREGLEAALIVAIVLAYLRQLGRREQFRLVLAGALAGGAVSIGVGAGVYIAIGELEGRAEQLTEGIIALVAVGVLTWMVFWMRQQARSMGGHLRGEVDRALATGAVFGLVSITFIGVLREGIETALFMLAVVFNASVMSTAVGGFAGLATAIVLGYLIYRGGQRINLRLFFQVTAGLVIIIAGGLFGKGVHELQEAGAIDTLLTPVWNLESNPIVGHGHVADFLKGLFGWSPAPSIEQLVVWAFYITIAGWFFYFDGRLSAAWRNATAPPASLAVSAETERSQDSS